MPITREISCIDDFAFSLPMRAIFSGSSQSGKTFMIGEILKHQNEIFSKTIEKKSIAMAPAVPEKWQLRRITVFVYQGSPIMPKLAVSECLTEMLLIWSKRNRSASGNLG